MVQKNKRIVIYGMITLMVGCVLVFIGCRHPSPEEAADRIATKMIKELELDETQQAQLESLKNNIVYKLKEMKTTHEQCRQEVKDQLQADVIDRIKLKQMVADHQEKMRENMDQIIDQIADLHETLSADQKAKLIELIDDLHASRHCRFH